MLKIGVTGNIASGKSFIESLLNLKGISTIDADRVVHDILNNNKDIIEQVSDIFAHDNINVKDEKGGISREKVGNIVFNDKIKLEELEKILHPRVIEEFKKFFNDNIHKADERKIVAGIVPLLYEANLEKMFDYVILVIVNREVQLKRLMEKRGFSEEEALARINLQMTQEEKINKADFIIDNSYDFDHTESQLDDILKQIENLVK